MSPVPDEIRIGTRASLLARSQTATVAEALSRISGRSCEQVLVRTAGDDVSRPLDQLGQGVFVSALRAALVAGDVDVVVHSYKDLPSAPEPGVVLAAVPARVDPRDVLVSRAGAGLDALPTGAVVGTSSPRRQAALARLRPDLQVRPVRGNVDTRIRLVRDGRVDAVVLARAGLIRLDRDAEADQVVDALLPAPAQGALAVECRENDHELREMLVRLDDARSRLETTAERHVLIGIGATCTTAVAALADHDGRRLRLQAELTDSAGATSRADLTAECALSDTSAAGTLGLRAAGVLHGAAAGNAPVLLVRGGAADPDVAALRDVGLAAVSDPYVRQTLNPDDGPARRLLAVLKDWAADPASAGSRWVVATSAHAVAAWVDGLPPGVLAAQAAAAAAVGVRAAAVGERTADTLRGLGFADVLVPSHATAADLVAALTTQHGGEALFPRGDLALPTLPDGLASAGWAVVHGVVYLTHPAADAPASVALLDSGEVSAVVLRSPSAARALASFVQPPRTVAVLCAGPTTAAAAVDSGLEVAAVAASSSPRDVALAVLHAVKGDDASGVPRAPGQVEVRGEV